ncbi:MAG: outer membrane beta-barrel protein [Ignavibacteria bacterium]|nr:outer membrane beta-barrel protein [Ignavibacteria bacterium]
MKKLVALFVILAAFLSLNNSTTFSQPQVKVHVTGGYNLPLPDLKGEYPADTNSMLQKSGFNAGADVKYYLGKKRNVGITLSGAYNSFSSGDISVTGGSFITKVNIIAIGLGVEYSFMPKGKTNPFLGAEFTGNFFSGNYKTMPTGGTETEATMKSASRFGIGVGGGLDFTFNKSIGAVVGVKYNMANLIGKDSVTSTVNNEYTLIDKETSVTKSKNLSYLQIYAGVTFSFNHPKARKK